MDFFRKTIRQLRIKLQRGLAAILQANEINREIRDSQKECFKAHENKIAVIRLDNIGDFILWLNGAKAIRIRYPRPHYSLVLIAPTIWGDFAFASGFFDDIIQIDRDLFQQQKTYRQETYSLLAARGFGTVIIPTYSREPLKDDAIARATKAPVAIANKGDATNAHRLAKAISDYWFTQIISTKATSIHELDRNFDFGQFFDPLSVKRVPSLTETMTVKPPWLGEEPFFVVFVGASWIGRTWPLVNFAELARRIQSQTAWKIIICGSKSDADYAKKLEVLLDGLSILNAVGQTSLIELAGVIASARLIITNETGAAHIAVATKTRGLCITGGGHFGRFFPYPKTYRATVAAISIKLSCFNCNWHCIYPTHDGPVPCIRDIPVDAAWEVIDQFVRDQN